MTSALLKYISASETNENVARTLALYNESIGFKSSI